MALTDNLVAMWRLEETSGNRSDSQGSNTLTDTNTVGSGTGKLGTGADFIAANSECLQITDNADLSMGDIDFTIAMWVKGDLLNANRTLLSKWNSGASQREYLIDYVNATNRFRFSVASDGTTQTNVSDTTALSNGTWYFIVCTHDATANQIAISVNDNTPTTASWSGGVFNGTSLLSLGAFNASSSYWDGIIDEVAIWKRKLSSAEITELYNGGTGLSFPDWSGGIVVGTLSVTSASSTAISLSTTAATGGVDTLTYQLQRTSDLTGATGWGNIGSAGAGLTFTDSTVSGGTTYLYRVEVTDGVSTEYTISVEQTAEGVVSYDLDTTGVLMIGRFSDSGGKRTFNSDNGSMLYSFVGKESRLWYTAATAAPVWVSIDGGAWTEPAVFSNTGTLTKSGDITGGGLSEGTHTVHLRIKNGQTTGFALRLIDGIEITSDATPSVAAHTDLAEFEYTRGTHAGLYWSDTFRGSLSGASGFSDPIYPGTREATGVAPGWNSYCEFIVDSDTTKLWVFTKNEALKQFSIWVDDVRYTDYRVEGTTNGSHGLNGPFTIPGTGQRKVRISDLLSLDGIGTDGAFVNQAVTNPSRVVVYLGDSVTAGDSIYVGTIGDEIDDATDTSGNWVHLTQLLLQNHKAYNKGLSGDTAEDVISDARVANDITPLSPDVVVCNLGINDSTAWVSSEAATRAQYVTIFEDILANNPDCYLAVVPQAPYASTNRAAIVAGLQAAVADVNDPRCVFYSSDDFVVSLANRDGAHPKDIGKAEITGYSLVMAKIVSQPSDGDTITITGSSGAVVFEFDNNASVTGGRTAVTIGGSLAATITNLADAVIAASGFDLFERIILSSDTSQQGIVVRNATAISKSGTNIEVYGPNPGWADKLTEIFADAFPSTGSSQNLSLLGVG